MKSLCKEVKNVRRGLKSERQHEQVVKPGAPVKAEEMPIGNPNRNMAEHFLQIKLRHQSTMAETPKIVDRSLKHVIDNMSFIIWNAVIDGCPAWPRKVVNNAKLPWITFATNRTQWGATKFGKWGRGERTSGMLVIQKRLDRGVNGILMVHGRLKIPTSLLRLVTQKADVGAILNYIENRLHKYRVRVVGEIIAPGCEYERGRDGRGRRCIRIICIATRIGIRVQGWWWTRRE